MSGKGNSGASDSSRWDDELFLRDLSEVYLLMDFISGRAGKSLLSLKDIPIDPKIRAADAAAAADAAPTDSPTDPVSQKALRDAMASKRVVEEICKIKYPPDKSWEVKAENAALILMVKDQLNELAEPARGLTVAFTAMFSGVASGPSSRPLFSWPPWKKRDSPSTKKFSAEDAYPNLANSARRFRLLFLSMPWVAILLLLLIVYINWSISITGTVLQQIDTAESDYAKLFTAEQVFLPTIGNCRSLSSSMTATSPATTDRSTDLAQKVACDKADAARVKQNIGLVNLQNLVRFDSVKDDSKSYYLNLVGLVVRNLGIIDPSPCSLLADLCVSRLNERVLQRESLEDFTIAVVGAFNGIVIPILFGLLGTLAGLMRSITKKVCDSTLAPRDRHRAWVAIFLGMSAGLAVGLFYNAADPSGAIAKNLGGTITVSAAGLSFLAGFGTEAFFTFLDSLILRVFSINTTANGNPMPDKKNR